MNDIIPGYYLMDVCGYEDTVWVDIKPDGPEGEGVGGRDGRGSGGKSRFEKDKRRR